MLRMREILERAEAKRTAGGAAAPTAGPSAATAAVNAELPVDERSKIRLPGQNLLSGDTAGGDSSRRALPGEDWLGDLSSDERAATGGGDSGPSLDELFDSTGPLAALERAESALAETGFGETAPTWDPQEVDPLSAYAEAAGRPRETAEPSPAVFSGGAADGWRPAELAQPAARGEPPAPLPEAEPVFGGAYQADRPAPVNPPSDADAVVVAVPRRSAADRRGGSRRQSPAARDRRAFTLRPGSPAREQLAETLDRILDRCQTGSVRSLVFASPGRRDAKTSLVTQLAVAWADRQLGEVLLIDADFRDSVLGRIFGLEGYRGAADVLMGWAQWSDVVRPTEVPRLSIAPSGSSVPLRLERLVEVDWEHLFAEVPERFRWVLIDTAQACENEVPAIAAGADAALLVVRLEHSDRYLAQEAATRFQESGANLLGGVLTETPRPVTEPVVKGRG